MDNLSTLNEALETRNSGELHKALSKLRESGCESEQQKALVERVIRTKAMTIANPKIDKSTVDGFVQFVVQLAKDELCSKVLTIQLLQDIFDASTTRRCEELFEIIENNIDIWKSVPIENGASFIVDFQQFFFDSCKNQILRMCNDLLKRLSRTIDTTFCGRILILLAKSLPFNEKSGLNLTGQFNTQNVTSFEREKKGQLDEAHPHLPVDDDMEVGEIREIRDANGAIPVDHDLYIKFWELQRFFSNPNLLFEAIHFKNFNEVVTEIFGIFTSYKLERPQRQEEKEMSSSAENVKKVDSLTNGDIDPTRNNKMNGYHERMELDGEGTWQSSPTTDSPPAQEHTFFAKYLTSQKLFPLQLADSQFRRYFLLQCLIVSNYLTSKARIKETYILTTAQEECIRELTDKCYSLLRETYPNGSQFVDAVKKTLAREKCWSSWKSEGCVDLVTPLLNSAPNKCAIFKRKAVSRSNVDQIDLGNQELTRLWNIQPNNLLACKDTRRKCLPDMKQFIDEGLDEMDPEQQVEEQYQSVNDEKYQWMASRFMLFNSDQYLSYLDSRSQISTASFLRKTIQMTAEHIPELKERSEEIQAAIKKKETAERGARLAAETKEQEKRLKQEEVEEQVAVNSRKKSSTQEVNAAAADEKKERTEKRVVVKQEEEVEQPVPERAHQEKERGPQQKRVAVKQEEAPQTEPEKPHQEKQSHQEKQRPSTPQTQKRREQQPSSERSERQRHTVPENEREELPKKRPKQDEDNSSSSSRRREEAAVEHDQLKTSSRKGEDSARSDEKLRSNRKRHLEKSEERKLNSGSSNGGGIARKGGSSRSSTDRNESVDRLKKRK